MLWRARRSWGYHLLQIDNAYLQGLAYVVKSLQFAGKFRYE